MKKWTDELAVRRLFSSAALRLRSSSTKQPVQVGAAVILGAAGRWYIPWNLEPEEIYRHRVAASPARSQAAHHRRPLGKGERTSAAPGRL